MFTCSQCCCSHQWSTVIINLINCDKSKETFLSLPHNQTQTQRHRCVCITWATAAAVTDGKCFAPKTKQTDALTARQTSKAQFLNPLPLSPSHTPHQPPRGAPKNTSAECFRMFPLKLLLDNFPSGFYNCPLKLALKWCDHISHKWSYVTVLLIAIPCVCSASTLTPSPQHPTPPRLPVSCLLRGTEEHQSLCHKSDLKPFFASPSAVFCLFKIPEKCVQRRMRCSNKSSITHAAGSVALDKTLISFLFLWFYK